MVNKSKKNNTLIKKKNLILELNKQGVKRISPNALEVLENYFSTNLKALGCILKQEIDTNGRRIAKKEDVLLVIEKLKTHEDSWEI
jgi:histone H3/H4